MKWIILIIMCVGRVIKLGWEGEEEEEHVVNVLTGSSINPLLTSHINLFHQFGITNQQIVQVMVDTDGPLNAVSSILVKDLKVSTMESLRFSLRVS